MLIGQEANSAQNHMAAAFKEGSMIFRFDPSLELHIQVLDRVPGQTNRIILAYSIGM
jgi:hypothetical protein